MTNGARDPTNRPASDAAKPCQAPEEVLWTEGQLRAAVPAAAGTAARSCGTGSGRHDGRAQRRKQEPRKQAASILGQ